MNVAHTFETSLNVRYSSGDMAGLLLPPMLLLCKKRIRY